MRALSTEARQLTTGEVVGDYLLLEPIGRGTFATVWRGMHQPTRVERAVKVFSPDPKEFPNESDRREAAVRFFEGAHAMAQLAGEPHVVELRDGPHAEPGCIWFAMDLFPDGDLAKAIERSTLTSADKRQIITDVLEALRAAHTKNIRHRDIKPQNILLRRQNSVIRAVLTDFDIAYFDHIFRETKSTVATIGPIRYLPPEVLRSSGEALKTLIRRKENDLYALCIVTLELFSDSRLNSASTRRRDLYKELVRSASSLSRSEAHRVASFCARGLGTDTSDPNSRYSSSGQALTWWLQLSKVETSARVRLALSLTCFMLGLAILCDWAPDYWPNSDLMLVRYASGVFAFMGPASLLATATSWFKVLHDLTTRIAAHALATWLALLASVAILTLALTQTQIEKRLSEHRLIVADGSDCTVQTHEGHLVQALTGTPPNVFIPTDTVVVCRGKGKVEVRPRTVLRQAPPVVRVDQPGTFAAPTRLAEPAEDGGGSTVAARQDAPPSSFPAKSLCADKACTEIGAELEDKGQQRAAINYYDMGCAQKEADGCFRLGRRLAQGNGFPRDTVKAQDYFGRACTLGHFVACTELGLRVQRLAKTPEEHARALAHFERACAGDHGAACEHAGWLLWWNKTGHQDRERATLLYAKACRLGHLQSCMEPRKP